MTRVEKLQHRIHVRKADREHKRRLHQGHRARREARAVQHLRALLDHFRRAPRVMFDDTSVDLIPKAASAVAGYVNGLYVTYMEVQRRFPHAKVVGIAVSSDAMARCLDIEPGDATNADAARWYHSFKMRFPKTKPIFYTSASNSAALIAVLEAHGIPRKAYALWSAHYDGTRHVCAPKSCGYPAADGTQWTDRSNNRSLDESKLKPSFWERG